MASPNFDIFADGDGIRIASWEIRGQKGPIAGDAVLQELEATLEAEGHGGRLRLPEQVFATSFLTLRHVPTGHTVRLDALGALRGWQREQAPAIEVPVAREWQAAREKDIAHEHVKRMQYDWTYTTGYAGTYEGHEASSSFPEFCKCSEHGINRELLMARDPILWFAEIPLFESELDDNGVSQVAVKVRVMPRCFLVLMRFFLRVDGASVRLRETRLFAEWRDHPDPTSPDCLVREVKWMGGDAGELERAGVSVTSHAFADADSAAQALAALAPACMQRFDVEAADLGQS